MLGGYLALLVVWRALYLPTVHSQSPPGGGGSQSEAAPDAKDEDVVEPPSETTRTSYRLVRVGSFDISRTTAVAGETAAEGCALGSMELFYVSTATFGENIPISTTAVGFTVVVEGQSVTRGVFLCSEGVRKPRIAVTVDLKSHTDALIKTLYENDEHLEIVRPAILPDAEPLRIHISPHELDWGTHFPVRGETISIKITFKKIGRFLSGRDFSVPAPRLQLTTYLWPYMYLNTPVRPDKSIWLGVAFEGAALYAIVIHEGECSTTHENCEIIPDTDFEYHGVSNGYLSKTLLRAAPTFTDKYRVGISVFKHLPNKTTARFTATAKATKALSAFTYSDQC